MSKQKMKEPANTGIELTVREHLRGCVEQSVGALEVALSEAECQAAKDKYESDTQEAFSAARALGSRVEGLSDRIKTLAHNLERAQIRHERDARATRRGG